MPRPRHIQQQIDAGNAAFEANLKGEPIPDDPGPGALPAAQVIGGLHEPEPVFDGGSNTQEPVPLQDPPSDEPEPPNEPEPPEDGDNSPDALQRAKNAAASWKGRYKAEIGRLSGEVQQLTELTRKQMDIIADLHKAPPVQATQPIPAEPEGPGYQPPTDEERRHYGEEFSTYMERVAQAAVQKHLDEVKAKLAGVDTKVTAIDKRSHQQRVDQFYVDLTRLCPTYQEVDADPDFAVWLGQVDPYAGEPRKKLLANAAAMMDSQRAAQFFLGFLAEQEAVRPPSNLPPPGQQAGPAGEDMLKRMASPGRARQPATREAPAPEKITAQQVKTFYADVTKGKYRSDPQAKADMVRRIEAALLSGNLTQQ